MNLATLAVASFLALAPTMAGSQEIDPYNIPDGGLYVLEQPKLTMRGLFYWHGFGSVITIFTGSVVSIGPQRCEDGVLWYRATRLEPRTLDVSRHIEGWIRASDIQPGGLSHFDSLRVPVGPPISCRSNLGGRQ